MTFYLSYNNKSLYYNYSIIPRSNPTKLNEWFKIEFSGFQKKWKIRSDRLRLYTKFRFRIIKFELLKFGRSSCFCFLVFCCTKFFQKKYFKFSVVISYFSEYLKILRIIYKEIDKINSSYLVVSEVYTIILILKKYLRNKLLLNYTVFFAVLQLLLQALTTFNEGRKNTFIQGQTGKVLVSRLLYLSLVNVNSANITFNFFF